MNSTNLNTTIANTTIAFTQQAVTRNSTLLPTAFPKQPLSTVQYVITPAIPLRDQNTIIGAVVFAMLVTLGVIGFILYRYMCSNKGDYRTTGEPAPGDHFYDEPNPLNASDKKEYFI